jgi:hypothetical protein
MSQRRCRLQVDFPAKGHCSLSIALVGLIGQSSFELLRIVSELRRELFGISLELLAEVSPRIAVRKHDAHQGDDC